MYFTREATFAGPGLAGAFNTLRCFASDTAITTHQEHSRHDLATAWNARPTKTRTRCLTSRIRGTKDQVMVPRLRRSVVLYIAMTCCLLGVPLGTSGQDGAHTFGNPSLWQWPPTRHYHVEHYELNLRFNQPKAEVLGNELITLLPLDRHLQQFYLDSSGLQIDSVTLELPRSKSIRLTYRTEGARLWIILDHVYENTSALQVRVLYHGFPRAGLYFTRATLSYPDAPQEIFSQGEPEFNHYWFPCWDYPNDMATSETVTTVPEGQTVVSNGRLVKVTHSGGYATYDWIESVPHSSYLTSLAVGPWRKVSDRYKDRAVDYYVPKSVSEATARRSFHLTPDMIGFFSRATGVDYPYEKYAQTTVHDFPFGGQENVSATTLREETLHDSRAEQDYPSTLLVAHELGQHWFGDYVQGSDWANIWLNEGFATYLTALYTQYHEGNDAYRFEIYNDQRAEQDQDRDEYRRPIVDRHYSDPTQMFDKITHEKGASVLEMLRFVLGGSDAASRPASPDEPLFRALHRYLITHKAQSADTAELIEAIEASTGQNLEWFFREWVFMAGHPEYRVEATFDSIKRIERLVITQTQQIDSQTPLFDMPVELVFYGADGECKSVQVRDNLQRQEFDVPLDFEPMWVDFDPDDVIDKTVRFEQPLESLISEAEHDPSMMSRLWAVQQIGAMTNANSNSRVAALAHALTSDRFYGVRSAAAVGLGNIGTDQAKLVLLSSLSQSDSRVRAEVVAALGSFATDPAVYSALVNALDSDLSYAVESAAAQQIGRSGLPQAFDVLKSMVVAKPEVHVMMGALSGLAATGDPRAPETLLGYAEPGIPERIRLSALDALIELKTVIKGDYSRELLEVVRAALNDPFSPLVEKGQELVGEFYLSEFEPNIEREARLAPTNMQREAAARILAQLHDGR